VGGLQLERLHHPEPPFAATDTETEPWYAANSDDKRRARLNIITSSTWSPTSARKRLPWPCRPVKRATTECRARIGTRCRCGS